MLEEKIKFETDKLFYNPEMRFNRSFGSLSLGAIEKDICVLDGFAASGIRGLRYATENKNIKKITFLDIWKIAPKIIKKNIRYNKLENINTAEVYNFDFNEFVIKNELKNEFDLVEIDPFGSPVPYLNNAFYSFRKRKSGYLSICATDVAVLCGENARACRKKYGAKNLRNEFTHETGTRILLKKISDFASQFDFGIMPLYSLSDRHYIKVLLKISRSAQKASEIPDLVGYVSFCFHCGYRETAKFPNRVCANCKKNMDYAGPLWLGELHEKKFLVKMKKINAERNYSDKIELEKTLNLLIGEVGMPLFYFNLNNICKRKKYPRVPKINELIAKLKKKGFKASRTHFCEKSIKTNATIEDLTFAITA